MHLQTSDPNISTLIDRIGNGRIDLQPDFQRGEVWSLKKRQRLIDTLLRDWHVPPIHLVKKTIKKDDQLEVLDGQQRLTAIWGFINNEFSIDGTAQPNDTLISNNHGKFWRDLDNHLRANFLDRTIRVLTIVDCTPTEAAELFFRLNQPTSLTAPEQRNAYFGRARDQVRALVSEMQLMGDRKGFAGFSNARMAYDDIVAKCLMTLEINSLDKKLTAGFIADKYRSGEPFTEQTESTFRRGLELFLEATSTAEVAFRLNKASSFSWIIFFSRFTYRTNNGNRVNGCEFFQKFYECFETPHPSPLVRCFFDAFNDRATSRVSDISSVKIRDFCLHAMYLRTGNISPELRSRLDLSKIEAIIPQMEEFLLTDGGLPVIEIVEYLSWGKKIID